MTRMFIVGLLSLKQSETRVPSSRGLARPSLSLWRNHMQPIQTV